MIRWLVAILVGVAFATAAQAQAQTLTTTGVGVGGAGSTYTGPGDVVSGATAWYGLRAYNAAYRGSKAINVRRASDNTTQDINVLAGTGALDIATANTFAGQDATASCTSASTTVACTGASSTPHVGSTITDGGGVTQPCYVISVGTFTGGAGNVTTNGCGTVSVGVATTFQYGLYVTKWYDQTVGNACGAASCDLVQATGADQPQLLPLCFNSLPCVNFNTNVMLLVSAHNLTPASGNWTGSVIGNQYTGTQAAKWLEENGAANRLIHANGSGNLWQLFGGSSGSFTATASDAAWHAVQAVGNGASSVMNVDGTETTGTATGSTGAGAPTIASPNGTSLSYETEAGVWDNVTFTGTQRTNVCKNQQAYYGSGNFGAAC